METAISKVSPKYQATIPLSIRNFLKVSKGDHLSFKIHNKQVVLEKLAPLDVQLLRAQESMLSEWNSPEDEELFRYL